MTTIALSSVGHAFGENTEFRAETAAAPEYLCVWESRAMPGIIHLSRLSEAPETAEWTLASLSGESHFRVTYYVQAADLEEVEEQVREALAEDEIKNQDGFYFTPRRFAIRAIEEATGRGAKAVNLGFRRARKSGIWAMAASILLPIIGTGLFLHATHKAPPLQKPAFRVGSRLAVNLPR